MPLYTAFLISNSFFLILFINFHNENIYSQVIGYKFFLILISHFYL